MNRKILIVALCLMLVCMALMGCKTEKPATSSSSAAASSSAASTSAAASSSSAAAVSEVTIVLHAPVTGNNSESGRQDVLGCEYAVDYVNNNGGIKALGGAKVKLVISDSTSDSNNAALALQRTLDANPDTVAIVGNGTSSMTLAILETLQKYKIPALCVTAANSTICEKGCEFIFQPGSDAQAFSVLQVAGIKYYYDKKGLSYSDIVVGIVYENSAWGQDTAKGNKKQAEGAGFKVAVEETYPVEGFTDAGPMITKLKSAGVNVLMPASYVNDTKLIMSTSQAMDFHPLIIAGGSAFVWPAFGKELGTIGNGAMSASNWTWDLSYCQEDKTWSAMEKDYKERWLPEVKKLDPEDMGEHVGPACLNLLMWVEAIEETKSTDPVVLRDYMLTMKGDNSPWFKMIHPDSYFDERGKNMGVVPSIGQWQDGTFHCIFPAELAGNNKMYDPATMQLIG